MKKIYLSVLVVLITIILVVFMVINNKQEDTGYIMVENEKIENIDENLLDNFINNLEENFDKENNKIIKEEIIKKEKNDIEKNIIVDKKEIEEKEIVKDNRKVEEDKGKSVDEKKSESESIQVFKVDKDLIMDMLTFKEKKDLAKIVRALSMSDYALIIESIKNDSELECIIKINKILEERLDKQEYNLIKEIVEPFINLEIL